MIDRLAGELRNVLVLVAAVLLVFALQLMRRVLVSVVAKLRMALAALFAFLLVALAAALMITTLLMSP